MKPTFDFLSGGGEMGALMRAHEWCSTPLGPADKWPEILKLTLRILLGSNHPMFVWWGPDLLQFYNDAYRQTMGPERHPGALGQPGRVCWAEIWDIIGPEIDSIMAGGGATWHEDHLVPSTRHGRREDIWWTYGFSPIEDGSSQSGVQGVLVICNDVTAEHHVREELISLNAQLVAQIEQREQVERHQAFQLRLMDKLGTFTNPETIATTAFQMLGEQLGVTRIHYAQIDSSVDSSLDRLVDSAGDMVPLGYAWNEADTFSVSVKGMGAGGTLAELGSDIISELRAGKTISVSDTHCDPRTRSHEKAHTLPDTRAILVVPIIKDKRLTGTLSLHSQTPYAWKIQEVNLVKEVAERIWNAIERARMETQKSQAQNALLANQREESERLRSLFQQAPGFVAIVRGAEHRFEIVNDAYLALVGFRELLGKTVREALPELEGQGYYELLDQVYASGERYIARELPAKLQRTAGAELEERIVDFVYQPFFDAEKRVSGIFIEGSDVTQQYQSQRRQRFLLELADRLRPLSLPDDIISAASALLGMHLGVSRVLFAEVDDASGSFLIRRDWTHGVQQSVAGKTRWLDDFGLEVIDILRKGQVLAQDDILADARTAPQAQAYATVGVRSQLAIPLVKDGAFVAILALHQSAPYHWTEEDRQTAQDMAERTWAAVENARAQAELSVVRNQSAYVFATMTEGFAVVDRDWRIVQMNAEGLRLSQRTALNAIGRNHWEVFPEMVGTEAAKVYERVKTSGIAEIAEHYHTYPDGQEAWIEVRIFPALDGGLAFFFRDVSERKSAQEEIQNLAFFDSLTNLPNRRLLQDRLQRALVASARSQRTGALLFIDLDDFKTLNDTLGHDIGDLLLIDVAKCLNACVREGDAVARLGGDEFVVILENLSGNSEECATQVEHIGEKILTSLNQIRMIGGYDHHTTASIGITLFCDHVKTAEELMKCADLAMYQAKAAGRNTLVFFDPEMQIVVTTRAHMEMELRGAILKKEFVLYFQPQVDENGILHGFEALARWKNRLRGVLLPREFLPLIEKTALIFPFGCWVLENACAQLATWAANPKTAHLCLSVNVSARQFRQSNFVDHVMAALDSNGANPCNLKLELTEYVMLDDVEDTIIKMNALKGKGVRFSLDDFGTGYASLSYLKRLPFDQLKIDQSFIQNLLTDPSDTAIVKMVVELAQSMNIEVIAEGVETEGQRDFLVRHGCRAYQGYLFSFPLSQEALAELLRQPDPAMGRWNARTVLDMNPMWNRRYTTMPVKADRRASRAA